MAKKPIGVMACEGQNCKSHDHGQKVVVKENEKGTLSYSCDWCGRSPYARPGTDQHADWVADMKPLADKVKQAGPTPAPAEKKTAGTLLG